MPEMIDVRRAREARAILFDLDDTLYPERRFLTSGFAAVARAVERTDGVPARTAYRTLVSALRGGRRATAFQELCEVCELPPARVPEWVTLVRAHTPRLRTAARTRALLASLRGRWRLGLVTNGTPDVQRRKVESLGLLEWFDHVCFAGLPGEGGKPAPEPFVTTCAALGVPPARSVHVGDNPDTDVLGAHGAGLKTILLATPTASRPPRRPRPDRVVHSLFDVPDAAEALLHDA